MHCATHPDWQPYTMCGEQRWNFNVPTILLWYTGPSSLGVDPKNPTILGLKAFCQFSTTGTRSA